MALGKMVMHYRYLRSSQHSSKVLKTKELQNRVGKTLSKMS